jgi:UDP-N-acetylglucosamine 2-epimerase (non-hydrolysing)
VKLAEILDRINVVLEGCLIIFPIHPRTRKIFQALDKKYDRFEIVDPMSYLEFIYIVQHSIGVITDSGGITEETSVMNIPCITLRNSSERPETITLGTNELVTDLSTIGSYVQKMIHGDWKQAQPIKYWDGKTAERIVEVLSHLR